MHPGEKRDSGIRIQRDLYKDPSKLQADLVKTTWNYPPPFLKGQHKEGLCFVRRSKHPRSSAATSSETSERKGSLEETRLRWELRCPCQQVAAVPPNISLAGAGDSTMNFTGDWGEGAGGAADLPGVVPELSQAQEGTTV